jgi:superfamily II helicase
MTENLITPENVSMDLIKQALDAAFMEYTENEEGELVIAETCQVFLSIHGAKKTIQLSSLFGFKKDSSELERLQAVNTINNDFIVIKATSDSDDTLAFRYDFMLTGGLTTKALIQGIKRFAAVPQGAIAEHADAIVE